MTLTNAHYENLLNSSFMTQTNASVMSLCEYIKYKYKYTHTHKYSLIYRSCMLRRHLIKVTKMLNHKSNSYYSIRSTNANRNGFHRL